MNTYTVSHVYMFKDDQGKTVELTLNEVEKMCSLGLIQFKNSTGGHAGFFTHYYEKVG